MGACFSRPIKHGDKKEHLPNRSSASSLASSEQETVETLPDGESEGKPSKVEESLIGNGLGNESFKKKAPQKWNSMDRRDQGDLKSSAEYWDHGDRVHNLPDEALVEHYHKDAELILKGLGRLEQSLQPNHTEAASGKRAALQRTSVTLRNIPEATPRRAMSTASTLTSHLSEALSICDDEGLVPGLPNMSLKVLLTADPLIVGAKQDVDDGRMLTARKKLKTWAKRHGLKVTELEKYSKQIGIDVKELQDHCTVIERAVEVQRNEEGYRVARDDGELRVLYKAANHGKHHCVKMEATLPFPLERPLSLAREFDLMKTWNKYMTESDLLYAPTIWESFVYAGMWMPFPFPQMECLAKGRGYDTSEEYKCLIVACESIEPEDLPKDAKPVPKPKKHHHRAEIVPGSCIRLEPLPPHKGEPGRTKGSIVMMIDAHVPKVPPFIVNWVLGVMAPFAHRQIKKLLENDFESPEKPFPKRMAAQPELYDKVRAVVKQGLEKQYGKEKLAQIADCD